MSSEYSTPPPAASSIRPYTIKIPTSKVQSLQKLVEIAPVAQPTWENLQEDRKWGLNRTWVVETKKYWTDTFKWEEQEAALNALPQFMATVQDDDGASFEVHFMALFSKRTDAVPVALFHGWPGSFMEFLGIFAHMKQKYSADDLPYHLIVPSLVGYTLSSGPPTDKNWTTDDTARIMNKLMIQLGFGSGYVAQGGDVGSHVARILAMEYDECKAIHINFLPSERPKDGSGDNLTKQEEDAVERVKNWLVTSSAYAHEHGNRTATIGLVLASSPMALLSWIGEKFLEWTDEDPDLDEILRSVSLYWLTDTFPRCIYPYRQEKLRRMTDSYVSKPFGFSWFPKEILPSPKPWIAANGNLVWFRAHDHGGHFAAMENPKVLASDLEEFIAQVWPSVPSRL